MGNYIVSARKYRPSDFDEVVGQEHITTTLKNAIDNEQLAQALLFCGPRGVGKTTCARIVARLINSFDKETVFGASPSLNIYELDAASNNSVEDIRNLIDQVRFPPQYGKYKVYIIDEVHMLSNAAFNAFLKTLEEPPPYAIFILATTEKHKVIPTILSRCQIYDFNRISVKDISDHVHRIAVRENIESEPEAIHLIAQKSEGALRDALSLFDLLVTYSSGGKLTYKLTIDNLHILDYDYYFRVTDAFMGQDISAVLNIFDNILKKGFDGQNFIIGLAEHFRNLLVCKDKETLELLEVTEAIKDKYLLQTRAVDSSFLLSAINIANQCDLFFKSSKNQRLHVEIALMKITYLKAALKLSGSDTILDDVKKKVNPAVINPAKNMVTVNPVTENAVKVPDKMVVKIPSPEKKTLNIPSLTDIKKKIDGVDTSTSNASEDDKSGMEATEEINTEVLQNIWKDFANEQKRDGKSGEYNILAKNYQVVQPNRIIIPINNRIEEDILDRFKSDLITYLKMHLKNKSIQLETVLNQADPEVKLYTNSDKFNYLAEKYPILNDLRGKLGLDPEF